MGDLDLQSHVKVTWPLLLFSETPLPSTVSMQWLLTCPLFTTATFTNLSQIPFYAWINTADRYLSFWGRDVTNWCWVKRTATFSDIVTSPSSPSFALIKTTNICQFLRPWCHQLWLSGKHWRPVVTALSFVCWRHLLWLSGKHWGPVVTVLSFVCWCHQLWPLPWVLFAAGQILSLKASCQILAQKF